LDVDKNSFFQNIEQFVPEKIKINIQRNGMKALEK